MKKETIIDVDEKHYTKVLEIQAERFRKIEKNQWKALQKMLFVEMKKAVSDQAGKQIIQKQDNIAELRNAHKKRLDREREEKLRSEREEARRREEQQMHGIKEAQRQYLIEAQHKQEQEKHNRQMMKALQAKREAERLQREEYFRRQKLEDAITNRNISNERRRQLELREKETLDRLENERKEKEKQNQEKQAKIQANFLKAKENLDEIAQTKISEVYMHSCINYYCSCCSC
jgi:hypothetical protein